MLSFDLTENWYVHIKIWYFRMGLYRMDVGPTQYLYRNISSFYHNNATKWLNMNTCYIYLIEVLQIPLVKQNKSNPKHYI